jgi:hypothetical protein
VRATAVAGIGKDTSSPRGTDSPRQCQLAARGQCGGGVGVGCATCHLDPRPRPSSSAPRLLLIALLS